MSYTVSYYVGSEDVRRYRTFGNQKRCTGYATCRERFATFYEAEQLAQHLNSFAPEHPARVVESSDSPNSKRFIVGKWTRVAAEAAA